MEFETEQFTGPLDMLLGMLDKKKFSITEVSLSEVTEQYLKKISDVESHSPDELADFLVVATRLVLMKSRRLLPDFLPEMEEDGQSLEEQLRIYKKFVDVSHDLLKKWDSTDRSFGRVHPKIIAPGFYPSENLLSGELHSRMVQLISRLKPPKALPKMTIDKTFSLKQKLTDLKVKLKNIKRFAFFVILIQQKNRSEIIVSFLAILELVKQKEITLTQDDNFSDIFINSIN